MLIAVPGWPLPTFWTASIARTRTVSMARRSSSPKPSGRVGCGWRGEPGNTAPLVSQAGLAGVLEVFGGALIVIGLFTRPVAFVLSGEMAFAYFMGHMFKGETPVFLPLLNGGTAAILFCFACLYLSAAGGGPVSADAALGKD